MRLSILMAALALPVIASAQCAAGVPSSGTYGVGQGASGNAAYVISMPQPAGCFNGTMILYAHGYVPVGAPPAAWQAQLSLPDGTNLPALANSLGFGFAASSFSKDGLAILQGVQDTNALRNVIQGQGIAVTRYLVAGASEGGLIAAKVLEEKPDYDGGLAVCGPVGDFRKQLNYIGDVRVLFDYFFPGVLSSAGGSAINIPPALQANWATVYEPAVRQAINSNPFSTLQLIAAANIPIGLQLSNAADAITAALWYNVFGTTDAQATLGGNAYDNIGRVYRGSFNNIRLNAQVARFSAAPAALAQVPAYNTSGRLFEPLVTLHTLADPVVPYEQETLYAYKVAGQGKSSNLAVTPSLRFGHCNVSAGEATIALFRLLLRAQ